MKKTRKKNGKWFIKVRGSYLPNSPAGWLTYIPYVGYVVGVTGLALHERYGFVTTALVLIPNWVAAAAIMELLAANHS